MLKSKSRSKISLVIALIAIFSISCGRKVYFQDWPLWLEKGYIDLACVMSYTQSLGYIKDILNMQKTLAFLKKYLWVS
ncbi:MAG TPA: hypothetical protein PKX79_10920 [Spirochaetota bacterium]|nr:hypothetical protein [Spirochaetota bacterium]HON15712.1 hypothetical protein [Spirochaetota bacterium]HPD79315.1 hypothetical protein [Spirochaetota bacterium]HPP95877.1 hypothetical protein [Spirochaetota bacterium]HRS62578.1 hypothetical protein [Spirochaetota bacterium]